jgi:2-polyprenyl-6-methoxyphenol hydroxylase-like FAD-dependent oxidoreductase
MSSNNFKVIIVGGGPVGLTAANALFRAGIDFVLLESRPNIVIDAGSNLVLLPMGLRFLAQIGVLDTFSSVSSPLGKIKRFDHDGNNLGDASFFIHYQEKYAPFLYCPQPHSC